MVVNVAVEYLSPPALCGESDRVIELRLVGKVDHHDHVFTLTGHPTVKRQHSVVIVRVEQSETFGAQGSKLPAEMDELAGEPQMVPHRRISRSEGRRLLSQGGVKLDGEALDGESLDIPAERLDGRILQVGKRRFARLTG